MLNFNQALVKWNGGITRGAQTRFAKALGISNKTVSLWARGTLQPGERQLPKIARELGIAIEDAMILFKKPIQNTGSPGVQDQILEIREALRVMTEQISYLRHMMDSIPKKIFFLGHARKEPKHPV